MAQFERLANEVEDAIRHALSRADIKTSAIHRRVKSVDSFLAKVACKGYSDPFDQNDDFARVRIVGLFTRDVERVGR